MDNANGLLCYPAFILIRSRQADGTVRHPHLVTRIMARATSDAASTSVTGIIMDGTVSGAPRR